MKNKLYYNQLLLIKKIPRFPGNSEQSLLKPSKPFSIITFLYDKEWENMAQNPAILKLK